MWMGRGVGHMIGLALLVLTKKNETFTRKT